MALFACAEYRPHRGTHFVQRNVVHLLRVLRRNQTGPVNRCQQLPIICTLRFPCWMQQFTRFRNAFPMLLKRFARNPWRHLGPHCVCKRPSATAIGHDNGAEWVRMRSSYGMSWPAQAYDAKRILHAKPLSCLLNDPHDCSIVLRWTICTWSGPTCMSCIPGAGATPEARQPPDVRMQTTLGKPFMRERPDRHAP